MSNDTKKITTQKCEVTFLEEGIVENYIKPGIVVEAVDLEELKKISSELAGNKPYVIIVTSGELASFSKEARELSASKSFITNAVAKAIVVDSIAKKIIGNFYLRVNKPYLPTKLFSDRAEALTWLRSIINKQ
ncbi:MAG: hypothetical protein H0U95_18675 [Bacteroidetes bacterium]|nr:hypothetical protein [Bacteroidota bacterium]